MGNTGSTNAHRRSVDNQRSRHRAASVLDEEMTTDDLHASTAHERLQCLNEQTSASRKRGRFSSLRNPFRFREKSSRSGVDTQNTAQRRNRPEASTRRRRTRSVLGTTSFHAYPEGTSDAAIQTRDLDATDGRIEALEPTAHESPPLQNTRSSPIDGQVINLLPPRRLQDMYDPTADRENVPDHEITTASIVSPVEAGCIPAQTVPMTTELSPLLAVETTESLTTQIPDPSVSERRNDSEYTQSRRRSSDPGQQVSRPTSLHSRPSQEALPRSGEVVSPMPGEDQAGMLSRLLSVAAAATAASLVGTNNQQALRDAREVAIGAQSSQGVLGDDLDPDRHFVSPSDSTQSLADQNSDLVDGSFDGFLAALQSGRLAQALRNGGNVMGGGVDEVGAPALNFFRMFRFSSAVSIEGSPPPNDSDGRMVPIIIVGIRSVPSREQGPLRGDGIPPFLDALGLTEDAPLPNPSSSDTNVSIAGTQTESEATLTTEAGPRRDLRNNAGLPPESGIMADEPTLSSTLLPSDVGVPETVTRPPLRHAATTTSSAPNVPARTPFSRPVLGERVSSSSRPSSRDSRRRTRPMSGIMESVMDRLRSFRSDQGEPDQPISEARSRRRSSWRPFSNNHTANEDDDALNATGAATRSWIIYVLGGTYPENHPLLTTPSLFSDSPTYEDMLLLSNLIGPAKPETALADDIENAGPTFSISEGSSQLTERCQVCLGDYEIGETCRKLIKCEHFYHQECIDEWLTTGRNNCPLCRSDTAARTQGVAEEVA